MKQDTNSQSDLTYLAIRAQDLLFSVAADLNSLASDGLPANTSRSALNQLQANSSRCTQLAQLISTELDHPVPSHPFLTRLLEAAKPLTIATAVTLAVVSGTAEGVASESVQQAIERNTELAETCGQVNDSYLDSESAGLLIDGKLHVVAPRGGLVVGSNPQPVSDSDHTAEICPPSPKVEGSHLRIYVDGSGGVFALELSKGGKGTELYSAADTEGTPTLLPRHAPVRMSSGDSLVVGDHTIQLI